MKKVGLITIFTGYNYGTTLQAFAMNELLSKIGYTPVMVWYNDSIVRGRDIRITKLAKMFFRTFFRPKLFKKTFKTYANSLEKGMTAESKRLFAEFTDKYLDINKMSYCKMKFFARKKEIAAFVCGSAQIWNAEAVYVSPLYYLRFAPPEKRIAYAPSMGKSAVPPYNRKVLAKYINEFSHISIRENQGAKIIKELTGRTAPVVLDPTLAVNREFWLSRFSADKSEDYILFYFLDKPKDSVLKKLRKISSETGKKILALPYAYDVLSEFEDISFVDAGPEKFVSLIANADFVCTDSFHGIAFAINLNIPFLVFDRNYGTATEQSSRIRSILSIIGLEDRFVENEHRLPEGYKHIDFETVNERLNKEQEKSIDYLVNAINDVQGRKQS